MLKTLSILISYKARANLVETRDLEEIKDNPDIIPESVHQANIDETRNDNQNDGKTGDDGDDILPDVEEVKKVCQKLNSLHKEMYDHPCDF